MRADREIALPAAVHEYDRWLREGKSELGWRGDPRLSLHVGIVITQKGGYQVDPDGKTRFHRPGDKVGWGWVVLRHNEDGTDLPILQVAGMELDTIIPKLILQDPRTPGFEPVMDRVEREDAIQQKRVEDRMKEARGDAIEHLHRLVQERLHGRPTTRQVGGLDERPDRNLAKT